MPIEIRHSLAGDLVEGLERQLDERILRFPVKQAKRPPDTWTYDNERQRWRWPNTGRAVPYSRIKLARDRRISESRRRISALADRMFLEKGDADRLTPRRWERAMRRELRELHSHMRMMAVGGPANMRGEHAIVNEALRREAGYLRGFANDVIAGKMSEAAIRARADLYTGSSVLEQFADGRRGAHARAGFDEKRHTGPNDERTCSTCSSRVNAGWVPIDAPGFEIGDSECGPRCRHEEIYRRKPR